MRINEYPGKVTLTSKNIEYIVKSARPAYRKKTRPRNLIVCPNIHPGFADYMRTDKFADAIKKSKSIASKKQTAIMCAEAVRKR